jgi:hypothetical protein
VAEFLPAPGEFARLGAAGAGTIPSAIYNQIGSL